MLEFGPKIDSVLVAQRKLTRLLERAETAKINLATEFSELASACMPACLSAIEVYNEDASPVIDTETINLNIDLKNMTLGFGARLRDSGGREPDEELDMSDTEKIDAALKTLIEAEFKNQGIPFTFTRIRVPTEYFTK